jgi:hypothetical protein
VRNFRTCRLSLWLTVAALILVFAAAPAGATTISYISNNLGGGVWSNQYFVTGHVFSTNEFLAITFSYTLYGTDLTDITPADPNWYTQVLLPDPLLPIPQDGEFDAQPLVDGAPPAAFQVSFTYLGVGEPGVQEWAFIDVSDFTTVLESGQTQPVPEPSTFAMLGAALAAAAILRRRSPYCPR